MAKIFFQIHFKLDLSTCFRHKFDCLNTSLNTIDGVIKYWKELDKCLDSQICVLIEFERKN